MEHAGIISTQRADEEIDLLALLKVLYKKLHIILLFGLLFGVITYSYTVFFMTPVYKTSITMYVNNRSNTVAGADVLSQSDLNASAQLVKTYSAIITNTAVLRDIISEGNLQMTEGALRSAVSISAVNSTEVFQVFVTDTDPRKAAQIADSIANVASAKIAEIVEGSSVKIISYADIPSHPSGPDYKKYTMIGTFLGCLISAGAVAVWHLFNRKVTSPQNCAQWAYPLLTIVPDEEQAKKSSRYGYKSYKNSHKYSSGTAVSSRQSSAPEMDFSIEEAYKTLRTNVMFSIPQDGCKTILVSSAIQGEAKSTVAINLGKALAQNHAKVLLIDCDLRLPTDAAKLGVTQNGNGLSNVLAGMCSAKDAIQKLPNGMYFMPSCDVPPNPAELLGSDMMKNLLESFRQIFDYIILDTPPVCVVSDAIILTKYASGVVLSVRDNYSDQDQVSEALKKMEFVGSKILGLVYVGEKEENRHGYYRKKGYYGKRSYI